MENSFSFKYIKLGVALVFLLISSIMPGFGSYLLLCLGGLALMTAFASFGNYDYRGRPTKLGYKVCRYIGACLLATIVAIQVYMAIAFPNEVHFSIYATVIDIALISYMLLFKPSKTAKKAKTLKVVGYALILIGINALQFTKGTVIYLTYTSEELKLGNILMCITLMGIGILLVTVGNKKVADGEIIEVKS